MIKELNLPCRYKVSFNSETLLFFFTTKNNIHYQVAFIDSIHLFSGTSVEAKIAKVYSLNIEKISKVTEPLDIDVKEAVDCIVTNFFEDKENSLIYCCDSSDAKERLRMKKFSKWYEESLFKNNIIKLDDELGTEPINYTSFLYHYQNPIRDYLEKGYAEIIQELQKPE
ncbi:DUF6169 family protein [Flavobacterium psychrotrophum]|uniref:DUF6169 family protein n=1 Tax=Flavobacterium psychrotrophum TaxID=2294119 RepID=UPI000E310382|nr:DUF6169 family protein [Flavobacterium psychrotrophum]